MLARIGVIVNLWFSVLQTSNHINIIIHPRGTDDATPSNL